MDGPIHIQGLTKVFNGGFKAVDNLDLMVPQGSFMGFLGPNGAGKTTTIKIITNMLTATSGHAFINGINVMEDPKTALADVGAVVETPEFYPYLTPMETLQYLGSLRGMSATEITNRGRDLLDLVKMSEWTDQRVGKFSKGMKQRLAIAQALLSQPSVIILDEPTSGLDPRGMVEVRDILKQLHKMDVTVLMSSHLLNEVQEVCTDVTLINRGKMLRSGSVASLINEVKARKIDVRTLNPLTQDMFSTLRGIPGVENFNITGDLSFAVDFEGPEDAQASMLLELQRMGLKVVAFKESGLALESLYMSLIMDSR
ncbi:MAG TPA: ABC transporter ATP-binding protein [Methanomassiliicoccales archaeon]|nr:ABC transporter ATP-binding protein [Methanomassiliicoccales archaeon]